MTHVDLGLTIVGSLTRLKRSLALMTLIKNLGRHNTGDVRACYRATATCPGPRQGTANATYPVRQDQTADTAVCYDTANIIHSFI
jgi:hypothetical protein